MTSAPIDASNSKLRLGGFVPLVRHSPATAGLLLLVTVATALTGGLTGGPAENVLAVLGLDLDGVTQTWWTLLISAFFAASWLGFLASLLVIAVGVGFAEGTVGSWRAVSMFLLGSVVSSVVLSVIPLLLLLMCSEGLRRGRRLALWTAMVINALVAVVVLLVFVQFIVSAEMEAGNVDKGFLAIYILPAAVVPAVITALLFVHRGKFQVTPGVRSAKGLLRSTCLYPSRCRLWSSSRRDSSRC